MADLHEYTLIAHRERDTDRWGDTTVDAACLVIRARDPEALATRWGALIVEGATDGAYDYTLFIDGILTHEHGGMPTVEIVGEYNHENGVSDWAWEEAGRVWNSANDIAANIKQQKEAEKKRQAEEVERKKEEERKRRAIDAENHERTELARLLAKYGKQTP